jgi:flagellar biosynthesis protein FlhF
MKIKSFFASSVDAALCEARRELGPDAMLIESRRSLGEARRYGEYEVVCAVTHTPGAGSAPRSRETGPVNPYQDRKIEARSLSGFEALVGRVERLAHALQRAESIAVRLSVAEEFEPAVRALEAAEVDPEWIGAIVNNAQTSKPPGASALDRVEDAIAHFVAADASAGGSESSRHLVAVVGPPGAGKTTALVKIAARHSIASRRPSLIISADTQRVAASEPLRSYAAILGAAFVAVDSVRGLKQTIEEHPGKEWIWIDTPGWSGADSSDAAPLMEFLASQPLIDTHLVLPASMRTADLTEATNRFLPARPSKLLFTRLDETRVYGPMLNESARTGLPLSFYSAGPQIPDDIAPADASELANWIVRGIRACRKAASAASAAA